jgi:proteasome lid subunit RPN8/RPN11
MANKVKLKKSQMDYFRRMARDSPLEIQAFLIGEVVSPNLTVIDYFAYPPKYAMQKSNTCAWFVADYEKVKKEAEERGRRVVGFMHSHPQWDAVLSPQDYDICISDMHRVCGICSTEDRRTRVRFWVMDSALPCEITYEKNTRAQEKSKPAPETHTA